MSIKKVRFNKKNCVNVLIQKTVTSIYVVVQEIDIDIYGSDSFKEEDFFDENLVRELYEYEPIVKEEYASRIIN